MAAPRTCVVLQKISSRFALREWRNLPDSHPGKELEVRTGCMERIGRSWMRRGTSSSTISRVSSYWLRKPALEQSLPIIATQTNS